MDPTQILIDEMRSKMKSHYFRRLRFWLISALIVMATGLVAWSIKLLAAHYTWLIKSH
jgi:hypothetical protein